MNDEQEEQKEIPVKKKGRPSGSKNKMPKVNKRNKTPKIINLKEKHGEVVNVGGRPKGASDVLPRGSMSVSRRIDILKSIAEDSNASGAERVASIRLISDILNDKLQNPTNNGITEHVISFNFPKDIPYVVENTSKNDKTIQQVDNPNPNTSSVRSIQNESLELDEEIKNAEVFKHQVVMKDGEVNDEVLAGENSLSPSSPKKVDEVGEIFADDKNDGDISVQFLFDEDNW